MRLPKYFFVVVVLFVASFIISCSEKKNNPLLPKGYGYYPGEIIAGFEDTVSYDFAVTFINSLNLKIKSMEFYPPFYFILQVDSGNTQDYIQIFSQDTSLEEIHITDYRGENADSTKDYLFVSYKRGTNFNPVMNFINSLSGISIIEKFRFTKWCLLKVGVGQEKFWVDWLSTYPFIKWTELNYIVRTNGNNNPL